MSSVMLVFVGGPWDGRRVEYPEVPEWVAVPIVYDLKPWMSDDQDSEPFVYREWVYRQKRAAFFASRLAVQMAGAMRSSTIAASHRP